MKGISHKKPLDPNSHTPNPIRVRMAPSPTGPLHIGTARTALFNWLFARKHGGVFILRIEDTDKERSEKKYEDELIEGLGWLGIDWDEFYRQSERAEIYKKYLEQLLASGNAYYCYCSKEDLEAQRQGMLEQGLPPKYNGHCRNLKTPPAGKNPEVIRFKVPEVKVEFKDVIRGKIVFDAALFGDIAIAKDLDTPLYNFAVVVDDEEMKISHVIRGEDHLSNTPKQILMQRALGFKEPLYAHIPLILNSDRSKMSKRFGDTTVQEFRTKGYVPEAIVNFLALLGWHPKDDQELFTKEELVHAFELERVQKAGAIFNQEKLNWLNREHMKKLGDAEIAKLLSPMLVEGNLQSDDKFVKKLVVALRERANTLRDFIDMGKLFFELPEYEAKLLIWKDAPSEEVASILEKTHEALGTLGAKDFKKETLSTALMYIISGGNEDSPGSKRGAVLWPLRVALSGQAASPDPLDIMEVLGKEESLQRIQGAIQKLKK